MDYQAHQLANLFPLMDSKSMKDLIDDIKANGLREDIILYEGQILDGRNRYMACDVAKVKPRFAEYDGDDPAAFVISLNLHRRHLNESQRAAIATKLATLKRGRRTVKSANLPIKQVTQKKAAEMLNVSERSVRDARKVLDSGAPRLVQAVEDGNMPVSKAAEIIRAKPETPPSAEDTRTPEEIEEDRQVAAIVNYTFRKKTKKEREEWRKKFGWQFDFEDGLKAIVNMPVTPAEYALDIPDDMIPEVQEFLEEAVNWLNEFSKHWRKRDVRIIDVEASSGS